MQINAKKRICKGGNSVVQTLQRHDSRISTIQVSFISQYSHDYLITQ